MAIHPTAIVDRHADIDSTVEIGPYCVIDGHVRVSAGCRLYPGVFLTGWTEIGEGCELHPGVIVGHTPQDTKYGGERSYCRIGRGTVLREYVTVHRGTAPESATVIGDDCFLLAGSHVGHNGVVGDGVTLVNYVLLGGHVEVGDRAMLGGGAVVHQFVRIGELTMVAGRARVGQDVLPFALTDAEGRHAGLNRVGLRRAGMTQDAIRDIREAYRILFASGVSLTEALDRLRREDPSEVRQRLIRFLEGESRRGLAGRSRRRRENAEPSGNPGIG